MKPVIMPHNNLVLKAPRTWDETMNGVCEDLHVTQLEGTMYSYWQPNLKQKLLILFGRHVRLAIKSEFHPPVCIDCED